MNNATMLRTTRNIIFLALVSKVKIIKRLYLYFVPNDVPNNVPNKYYFYFSYF